MIRVMLVCLGNICRSPMAECVMSDMLYRRGLDKYISVSSSATSDEELGNPIYPPARRKLVQMGIPVLNHYATTLKPSDGEKYDYIIGMEQRNVARIERIIGKDKSICRLLDFSQNPRDIADPWWTGNFDVTYDDIVEGCSALIDYIVKEHSLA